MKKSSWLKNGIILGFVFFLCIWLVKPVGVSTQFSVLSGIIHSSVNPNVINEDSTRETGYKSSNAYYDKSEGKLAKSIRQPVNYDFVFVLGIPLGAYLISLLKRKSLAEAANAVKEINEAKEINQVRKTKVKQNIFKQYGPSFIGGFLLLFGARMADGCTSGHMMSGMMQGSVSGYIFAAVVFMTAIPVALIAGRREAGRMGK